MMFPKNKIQYNFSDFVKWYGDSKNEKVVSFINDFKELLNNAPSKEIRKDLYYFKGSFKTLSYVINSDILLHGDMMYKNTEITDEFKNKCREFFMKNIEIISNGYGDVEGLDA